MQPTRWEEYKFEQTCATCLCFFLSPSAPITLQSAYHLFIYSPWASLVSLLVKNPPAIRESWVQSLGWEDSLEKGMATHPSILAWRIPWTV